MKDYSNYREILLRCYKISKNFPGIQVLKKVDFELKKGEVHVLFGENGAGKSTLISLIAGANHVTKGQFFMNGQRVDIKSVHDARMLGISAVFQEFSLVPQMTVEENLFLGAEQSTYGFLQKKTSHANAQKILDDLNFHITPSQRVEHLTRAEQQMVEIAKAFRSNLSILILDEPTASLTNHETEQLFKLINNLKEKGVGIIYITHRMSEIQQIGDRITVLRDGIVVDTVDAKTTSEKHLIQLMTGRLFDEIYPHIPHNPGQLMLQTKNLHTEDKRVQGVDIQVRAGEIVGLTGLMGSGKSECAQACFGVQKASKGEVYFDNKKMDRIDIQDMIKKGFLYLPSDRREEGLLMMRDVRENMSLASLKEFPLYDKGFLKKKTEIAEANRLADLMKLTPPRIERPVELFSGGNQQKVMISRSLTKDFKLLIFDEPTVGVDVATRVTIYKFIADLCRQGVAILLVSSDLLEVIGLSHRVYVLYRGLVQAEFEGEDVTEENILSHFFEKGSKQ